MPHPAVQNRRSGRRAAESLRRVGFVAAVAAGCLQSAVAQTLPSGAGYQIGDGSIPVVAPNRGVAGLGDRGELHRAGDADQQRQLR